MSNGSAKDTANRKVERVRRLDLKLQTKVFNLCDGRYHSLSELAEAMGISISQIYRVRQGKRRINEKFIIGAINAFPNLRLDELFYLETASLSGAAESSSAIGHHKNMLEQYNK
jgi:transcriptional regulator with XRE-family HTH domain